MRYVAAEAGKGRWGEVFNQLYPGGLFPDELGPAVIAVTLIEAEEFHRYLDHLESGKPIGATKTVRRVEILAAEDYPGEGWNRQVLVPYHPSIHPDTAKPYPLTEAVRGEFLDAAREPRKLATVRKHGASLADFSESEPWALPPAAISGRGEIIAGLVTEGFIEPEAIGIDDERLVELLGVAMRLSAHRLEVLAQSGGWREGNPLAAEYRLAAELVYLLSGLK